MASNNLPISRIVRNGESGQWRKIADTIVIFWGSGAWENGDQCGNLEAVGPRKPVPWTIRFASFIIIISSSFLFPFLYLFFPPEIIYDFSFSFFSKNRVGLNIDFYYNGLTVKISLTIVSPLNLRVVWKSK
jgi:hypothetical protein